MRWSENGNEYDAFEEDRGVGERNDVVDEFLGAAFAKIGKAYEFSDCPAIIFDLWSGGRLLVFDSPDGADLSREEKIYTQLSHNEFAEYVYKNDSDARIEHGNDSEKLEKIKLRDQKLTLDACRHSILQGEAKEQLKLFKDKPVLIWLIEGRDRWAHDLVSGKRIEMAGEPIEDESIDACQCDFCVEFREST